MLPHPALQFFPKLSTLSLQRSQEKQTLVEELEEKIEQLDILEEAVCRIIHCFPEELVESLKSHSSVQNLAEFAAEFDVDPLGDVQTALLIAASQKLEKLWRIRRQVEQEKKEKQYPLEELQQAFQELEKDLHSIITDFHLEQSSVNNLESEKETKSSYKLRQALETYQESSSCHSVEVTHEEVVNLAKKVVSLESQVQEMQIQLDTYQMLPEDPALARIVLDEAKEKLRMLDEERDNMLRSMKWS